MTKRVDPTCRQYRDWTAPETAMLCDHVAGGGSVRAAAKLFPDRTVNATLGYWRRIVAMMDGAQ